MRCLKPACIPCHLGCPCDLTQPTLSSPLICAESEVSSHSLQQVVDEASLTGESDPIKKSPDEDPWCRSGTQASSRVEKGRKSVGAQHWRKGL